MREIASTNPHALAELQVKMPYIQGTKKQMSTINKIEAKTGMMPQIQPLNLATTQQPSLANNSGVQQQTNQESARAGSGFFEGPGGQVRPQKLIHQQHGRGKAMGREDSFQLKNLNQTVELVNSRFQFDIKSEVGADSPQNGQPARLPGRTGKDFAMQE